MSEQEKAKSSFMQELDAWMEVNVIAPLVYSDGETEGEPVTDELIAKVKMAMRGKVLDSFHNGLRAGGARAG